MLKYFFPLTSYLLVFSMIKASSKYFKYELIVLGSIFIFAVLLKVSEIFLEFDKEPILKDITSTKLISLLSFFTLFLSITSLIYTFLCYSFK